MSKIFIDTNIFAYSLDRHDKKKQKKCRDQLKNLVHNNTGVISTQVIQEFYVTATKKLGVEPLKVKEIIHYYNNFEIVLISPEIIDEAIDCSIINKLSFWNSLIVTSAEYSNCKYLWTEDLQDGQVIRNVQIVNPMM